MGLFSFRQNIQSFLQGSPTAGPDGVNRCGALRGNNCEQKRYEAEQSAKQVQAEYEAAKTGNAGTLTTVLTFAGIFVAVILLFKYLKK